MSDPTLSARLRGDHLCDQFENRWLQAIKSGDNSLRPKIEELVSQVDRDTRQSLLLDLVSVELYFRRHCGEQPKLDEYARRFPESSPALAELFQTSDGQTPALNSGMSAGRAFVVPEKVGRFVVREQLGQGTFGAVFRAWDEGLQRDVAIKVPMIEDGDEFDGNDQFVREAQIAASLQHPNIVRLFDVLTTDEFPCVLVSEFIDGTDLARRIEQDRPDVAESARIVETIADALHFAHSHTLVHRDVKPANILLDSTGKAFLTDFGLALTEADYGKRGRQGGTVSYMSPEQARGEGHLVTATTDIFSLGAVFYELLTGRRAFNGGNWKEVLERVKNVETRSPRLFNEEIPRELERICMKALSKRAADRFSLAGDMARELRACRMEREGAQVSVTSAAVPTASIVPKGLRSFETEDADFFVELTPGPRDRFGVPDCIRFWKTRIENTTRGEPFRVGLIYGKSGAGKSSLVKAGIIPRLDHHVHPLFVDATNEDLEQQVLDRLAYLLPNLDTSVGLVRAMACVRRDGTMPANEKVVIFIDQFEQWLHNECDLGRSDLVAAIRQCDGHQLQAVLLVRDDFWIPVSRFMRELELTIVDGYNSAAVDLFDSQHAKKVLMELGHAYGRLRFSAAGLPPEQEMFVDQAISDLMDTGRVSPVQLALFCEVVKDQDWTMETYDKVGGAASAGQEFLQKTFAAPTAHARHRNHKNAAMSILESLIPPAGKDIKGQRRSEADLRQASGYGDADRPFRELMHMLDGELRVITPVDAVETISEARPGTYRAKKKLFQLTHDYLVPNIRAWTHLERGKSFRGRARLRLEELTQLWNADTRHRFRPSFTEFVKCRLFTSPAKWSVPQRQMMQLAWRYYSVVVGIAAAVVLALMVTFGMHMRNRTKSMTLVENVAHAHYDQVATVCDKLGPYRDFAVPQLQDRFERNIHSDETRFRYALALVYLGGADNEVFTFLYERLSDDPETWRGALNKIIRASQSSAVDNVLKLWERRGATTSKVNSEIALTLALLESHEALNSIFFLPSADPTEQTFLVHEFGSQGGTPDSIAMALIRALNMGRDAELARNLCLLLGEFTFAELNKQLHVKLDTALLAAYQSHPDPGVHGAVRWLLQRWRNLPAFDGQRNGIWKTSIGNTFIETNLYSCRVGSPESEPHHDADEEQLRDVLVNRTIAVALTELTYAELEALFSDRDVNELIQYRDTSVDCPAVNISWYFAAEICNRLSERDGIPPGDWCFAPNEHGKYAEGMSLKPNYLSLNGYRMPTAAEWEAVCRAGTTTIWNFGTDSKYLGKYAETNDNKKPRPVGELKPNRLGLFDTLGNVFEWTLTRHSNALTIEDVEEEELAISGKDEFLRVSGGAGSGEKSLRPANRAESPPSEQETKNGLRIVRTIRVLEESR